MGEIQDYSNEYYENIWREKLVHDEVTPIEIRLGIQVLVLNVLHMKIDDYQATKAFSDMYDSDYEYEGVGVATHIGRLIQEKKLQEAIDLGVRTFRAYLGELEREQKSA